MSKRPRLLFVHGSVVNAELTWAAQKPLADRFDLVLPNRRGFPPGLTDAGLLAPQRPIVDPLRLKTPLEAPLIGQDARSISLIGRKANRIFITKA